MAETFAERAARIIAGAIKDRMALNLSGELLQRMMRLAEDDEISFTAIIRQASDPEFKRLHDLIAKMRPVVEWAGKCPRIGYSDAQICMCRTCRARAVVKELEKEEKGK